VLCNTPAKPAGAEQSQKHHLLACKPTASTASAVLQDVLLYYGANKYGSGPPALGTRSPRNSFNPEAADFSRERGSYQQVYEAP
jgi:hypothetical protein